MESEKSIKKAYLTIDDAPSEDFLNKTKFLKEKKIQCIFFCLGSNLTIHRAKAIEAIKNGFIIGNHSWSHVDFETVTKEEIEKEITSTDHLINELYEQAGVDRKFRYFRFPYLRKGNELRSYSRMLLEKLKYSQRGITGITIAPYNELPGDPDVSCTYDSMDWTVADGSEMFGISTLEDLYFRMDENYPYRGRSLNYTGTREIIMMHDDIRIANLFEPLINRLLEKGIEFIAPDE